MITDAVIGLFYTVATAVVGWFPEASWLNFGSLVPGGDINPESPNFKAAGSSFLVSAIGLGNYVFPLWEVLTVVGFVIPLWVAVVLVRWIRQFLPF